MNSSFGVCLPSGGCSVGDATGAGPRLLASQLVGSQVTAPPCVAVPLQAKGDPLMAFSAVQISGRPPSSLATPRAHQTVCKSRWGCPNRRFPLMSFVRGIGIGTGLTQAARPARHFRRGYATVPSPTDVSQARKYCLNQLRSACLFPLARPEPAADGCPDTATMKPISSGTSSPGRPRMPMLPSGP